MDVIMLERYLKPYLIGYVNEHYEDVDDQLVFAYDEAHATKIVLETFKDAKFVFQSRPIVEQVSAAWSKRDKEFYIFLELMFWINKCNLTTQLYGKYWNMLKTLAFSSLLIILCSCGTSKGVLDGAGSVLEGLASDVRSVGDYLN